MLLRLECYMLKLTVIIVARLNSVTLQCRCFKK